MNLIKPNKLNKGDKVAAVSLSWGGAGDEEYKVVIKKVLAEFGREDMPVLYNGSFGHNEPKTILPYGVLAEINCENKSFAILESGVV